MKGKRAKQTAALAAISRPPAHRSPANTILTALAKDEDVLVSVWAKALLFGYAAEGTAEKHGREKTQG